MLISAIVATSKNNIIGINNQIPWYLSADLKFFKRTTINHPILMGRKTFQSIGRPLPKRTNIIITRDLFFNASNCLITHSIEEALELAEEQNHEEIFIIGGATIYEQSKKYWDRLYLTMVDTEIIPKEGDEVVYFPEIDFTQWELQSSDPHEKDEKNDYNYEFRVYELKK